MIVIAAEIYMPMSMGLVLAKNANANLK